MLNWFWPSILAIGFFLGQQSLGETRPLRSFEGRTELVTKKSRQLQGGWSGGGGGTSVNWDGRRIFLDLLMFEQRGLRYGSFLPAYGEDPYTLAKIILNAWTQTDFSVGSIQAQAAFSSVDWYYTRELPSEISVGYDKFYIPETLRSHSLQPKLIAYYRGRPHDFQVQIIEEEFKALELVSQVALVLHETLRHVQIGFGLEVEDYFSEMNLQKATAIYLFCKPSVRWGSYLLFLMSPKAHLLEQFHGPEQPYFEKHCQEPKWFAN
ncbi:MAG: hypothetical protein KDD43_09800 [Bdellovibrionales bacterium]|nr:hypothetical protein [Bdellovibrionales bacterium]